jgi:hypothetical protein
MPPAACSNGSLTGRYGFAINGTANGNPITAVGQIATNGNGTLAGNETISQNARYYRQSSRGVGHILHQVQLYWHHDHSGSGPLETEFQRTVISGGQQIDMVQTDSGTTELGTAQAQGSTSCSSAGAKGVYGLQGAGTEIGAGLWP